MSDLYLVTVHQLDPVNGTITLVSRELRDGAVTTPAAEPKVAARVAEPATDRIACANGCGQMISPRGGGQKLHDRGCKVLKDAAQATPTA